MHQSVVDIWHEFSTPLEGRVHSLYVDVKGLITTGVGNLVDPISLAEQLPWTLADGSKADLAQLRADWHLLKAGADYYSKRHWRFARDATKVRLTDEAIDALVARKLLEFEAHLVKHHFPEWGVYPADAQLGIMSMAWACGPGFPAKFTNFKRCVGNRDWSGAVASCKIREDGNPGVVPRNARNRQCFANAALVAKLGLDVSQLFWPGVPTAPDDTDADENTRDLREMALVAQALAIETARSTGGTGGAALSAFEADNSDDGPNDAGPGAA